MNQKNQQRLKIAGLLTAYGAAIYYTSSDIEKLEKVNDIFDGHAAMLIAASGTGTSYSINVTPHTVVDPQFVNVEAFEVAFNNPKILNDE